MSQRKGNLFSRSAWNSINSNSNLLWPFQPISASRPLMVNNYPSKTTLNRKHSYGLCMQACIPTPHPKPLQLIAPWTKRIPQKDSPNASGFRPWITTMPLLAEMGVATPVPLSYSLKVAYNSVLQVRLSLYIYLTITPFSAHFICCGHHRYGGHICSTALYVKMFSASNIYLVSKNVSKMLYYPSWPHCVLPHHLPPYTTRVSCLNFFI